MRGQYFSFDAIVAAVIFILALVSLLSAWNSLRTTLEHQSDPLSMEALRVGETLLTPGNPPDASCSDATALGLAISWSDHRINSTKLAECAALSPDDFQKKLGSGYRVSVFLNRVHALGEDVRTVAGVQDIGKARKIVSVHNETRDADGMITGEEEQIATMDIYVYR